MRLTSRYGGDSDLTVTDVLSPQLNSESVADSSPTGTGVGVLVGHGVKVGVGVRLRTGEGVIVGIGVCVAVGGLG